MPKRIQRKRTKGWRMPLDTIYIGRPSVWGNPYKVENLGAYWIVFRDVGPNGLTSYGTKAAVDLFRQYAEARHVQDPTWLEPLRGRNLADWCSLDMPCHGDVLLELANQEAKL